MGVWRIPDARLDHERFYPKPPPVEKRKCAAFRCKNRRSLSFPWIANNRWCTEHSRLVYFAAQEWMSESAKQEAIKSALPATNLVAYLMDRWRKRRHARRR